MKQLQTRLEKILFGSLVLALCTAVLPLSQALADLSHPANGTASTEKATPSCAPGVAMTVTAAGSACTSTRVSCPAGYRTVVVAAAPQAKAPARVAYACVSNATAAAPR